MEVIENASDDQQEYSGTSQSKRRWQDRSSVKCAISSSLIGRKPQMLDSDWAVQGRSVQCAICNERSADSNTRLCVQLKKLRKHPHHGIFSPSWDLEMTCCLVFSTKKTILKCDSESNCIQVELDIRAFLLQQPQEDQNKLSQFSITNTVLQYLLLLSQMLPCKPDVKNYYFT